MSDEMIRHKNVWSIPPWLTPKHSSAISFLSLYLHTQIKCKYGIFRQKILIRTSLITKSERKPTGIIKKMFSRYSNELGRRSKFKSDFQVEKKTNRFDACI